ncbi:hypothetical protein Pan44_36240 [Caulifigura coniformis]|uniref:HTH cro/C1-type domain-containing protein n=1 Tax=Caulifigura coniformis TaxID=2527983 RepID=A0A517SHI0_9PLAN|nr:hypothetical protein [Caulifigura coniformis]QDT55579.1 hypothetical protein Pan44_36240 [Caulifigura coniformis]
MGKTTTRKRVVKRDMPTPRLVAKVRELTGLSVAQVGQLVGVDRQTVWKWQHGAPARARHLVDLRLIISKPAEARELAVRAERGLLHLGSVAKLMKALQGTR